MLRFLIFAVAATLVKGQCSYTGGTSKGPGGLWYSIPVQNAPDTILGMTSTVHLSASLSLRLDSLSSQVAQLLALPDYDSPSLWKPNTEASSDFVCPLLAPGQLYDANPTQMFIGRPAEGQSVVISNTAVNVRLPDKVFGMFLAYAMDEYGLNPHMLLGLSTKESFAPAVGPGQPGESGMFLADDVDKGYDLYGKHFGYGTDANKDGPFQVEKFGMSTTASIFPGRFNFTAAQADAMFVLDNTIATLPQLDAFHEYWTKNMYRAVVLTSLDFHWRYNALLMVPGFGMRAPWDRRTTRKPRDALEFGTLMYVYNRGVYADQKQKLCSCSATDDPISVCGMDGYGGHSNNIRLVCQMLDKSTQVYDYTISWTEVTKFLDILQSTYPYSSNGASGIYGPINWSTVRSTTETFFQLLMQRRQSRGGAASTISYRYDWRTLLAVIRAHLPRREDLMGPTWSGMVEYSFGKVVGTDPGYAFDSTKLIVPQMEAEAGNRTGGVTPGPPSSAVTATITATTTSTAASTTLTPSSTMSTTTTSRSSTSSTTTSSSSSTTTSATISSTSTRTSTTSTSLFYSSTVSYSPMPTATPPPIVSTCTCPAFDGYRATKAPGLALKRCVNKFGVIVNACTINADGKTCSWGESHSYCAGGKSS